MFRFIIFFYADIDPSTADIIRPSVSKVEGDRDLAWLKRYEGEPIARIDTLSAISFVGNYLCSESHLLIECPSKLGSGWPRVRDIFCLAQVHLD